MSTVTTSQIELRETRRGSRMAYVTGTRISVQDIYVAHEMAGRTPDEIVATYPHLTLAQVHSALAYCFDHLAEIRGQLRSDAAFVEEMKTRSGPGPLAR